MFTKGYTPYNKGGTSWNKGRTYKCIKQATCKRGHENTEGSRYKTGACKLCLRQRQLSLIYNLTPQQYAELFVAQNGACAICGDKSSKRLHIDHSHTTGKVRGLLCTRCNPLLGYAREDKEILYKAVKYLEHED